MLPGSVYCWLFLEERDLVLLEATFTGATGGCLLTSIFGGGGFSSASGGSVFDTGGSGLLVISVLRWLFLRTPFSFGCDLGPRRAETETARQSRSGSRRTKTGTSSMMGGYDWLYPCFPLT